MELIRRAKEEGLPITCEVTPHHLTLTEDDVLESDFDPNFKVMPPLRTEEDIAALRESLRDGTIDAIATDHAPHALHEKDNPFDQTPFGVIGLETALSVVWTELVAKGIISAEDLVRLMAVNPAKILDLPAGTLSVGSYADITVFDPDARWKVDPKDFRSKSQNSPFIGRELTGRVVMTIVGGEIVFRK